MDTLGRQQGFTLLEILVALTIFAIGLLGIAGLQVRAIQFNSGSNQRTTVESVARMVMEDILARSRFSDAFQSSNTGVVCYFRRDTSQTPAPYTGEIFLDLPGTTVPTDATDDYSIEGSGDFTAEVDIAPLTSSNAADATVRVTGPTGRTANLASLKFTEKE